MRITSLLLLISVLFSCSVETEKALSVSTELNQYIRKRYETTDVTSTFGSETSHGKEEKYVEIRVGKSSVMDHSQATPELFASDIAFRLYSGMGKAEREKYAFFAVKLVKNKHETEIRYKNKTMQEATANLLWLEGFFRLVNQKDYLLAKGQFNPQMVDTSGLDVASVYEPLSEELGKLKKRELQGFIIGETSENGKAYRTIEATYISFYEKQYTLSHYLLLMDEPEQKLIALEME